MTATPPRWLPEAAPRLGRVHKLAAFAVSLPALLAVAGAWSQGGLQSALAFAAGPMLAIAVLMVARGAWRPLSVALLAGGAALFGAALQTEGQWTAWLLYGLSDAAGWPARIAGYVGLALYVGAPLQHFARALAHPAVEVRIAGGVGTALVTAGLAGAYYTHGGPLYAGLLLSHPVALAFAYAAIHRFETAWIFRLRQRASRLSVSLICKNEADRIERCLQAVSGWADEIVVVDSGSTDGTVEIARRYTDRVWVTDWPGYGKQKQRALEHCTGDWVLSLDADEVVDADLRREIDARLSEPSPHVAYTLYRCAVIFDGVVEFGADGDHHVRLFRRELTRFDEAMVHEDVLVKGPVGRLWRPLYHFTYRDFVHLKRKFAEYAWLQARVRHARGWRVTAPGAVARGVVSFFLLYVWRLGFLDGRRGLLMAGFYAHYTFDKYAALWSLEQGGTSGSP